MIKKYLLLLVLTLNATISCADSTIKVNVKKAVNDYVSSHFINGVYMFADDGGMITQGAKGMCSVELNKKLMPNQIMPIASATKPMTAYIILKLNDEKKLNVHDTIATHLDANSGIWENSVVPEWAHKITIHNLLTHRSGLPEYFLAVPIDVTKSYSDIKKDIANFMASKDLSFEPGMQHHYCNTNFIFLGLLIEKLRGEDLAQVFKKEIFDPLGMNNTQLISLELAIKYQKTPEQMTYPIRYFITPNGTKNPVFTVAKAPTMMIPYADGGVISTTEDLIKWHKALHSHKFLSEEAYKLMTTKHYEVKEVDGVKTSVGYGLFITELANGTVIYQHAGSAVAMRCEAGYIPSKNLYFAVISNVMNYIPKEMQDKIDMKHPANQLDIFNFTNYVFNAI